MKRKITTIWISEEILNLAKEEGINISLVCELALVKILKSLGYEIDINDILRRRRKERKEVIRGLT